MKITWLPFKKRSTKELKQKHSECLRSQKEVKRSTKEAQKKSLRSIDDILASFSPF